ncbi:MAG: hypothetical protein JWN86_2000 [Planctomycetota bacterium]|nr:hypothetical protein [Planctomycetota bacterium]
MDLKEKVSDALRHSLDPEFILLEDDEGISGFVVSSQFRGLSSLDRQVRIAHALRDSPKKFTKTERRQILAIAGLTPVEYEVIDLGRSRKR